MKLSSDAIDSEGVLDPRYTCDLDNSSPELRWEDVPPETKEFALIAEDLDSDQNRVIHWVVYHIPAHVHHLPAGIPPQDSLPNGIRQGTNSLGRLGYSGPCPPPGDKPHRYRFRLFALNSHLQLPSRVQGNVLLDAAAQGLITDTEIIGKYQRTIQRAG